MWQPGNNPKKKENMELLLITKHLRKDYPSVEIMVHPSSHQPPLNIHTCPLPIETLAFGLPCSALHHPILEVSLARIPPTPDGSS